MKNLKRLSREKLKTLSGGTSCAGTCSDGLYLKYKTEDIPDTVILRKYIYPVYPISRTTLNTILNTPIDRELNRIYPNEE